MSLCCWGDGGYGVRRELYKCPIPSDLFEAFIDDGNYATDISAYKPLVDQRNAIPVSKRLEKGVCMSLS